MPITTTDNRVRVDMSRATYDYDNGRLTVVWRLTIEGVRQPTEVTTELPVMTMLGEIPEACAAMYGWIVTQATTAGDIPQGTVTQ